MKFLGLTKIKMIKEDFRDQNFNILEINYKQKMDQDFDIFSYIRMHSHGIALCACFFIFACFFVINQYPLYRSML